MMKTKIIHEDDSLFVIHKPAGIAVQSARIGQTDCESELKNYLARQGKQPYIGLIHRLDQPVEGLLVVAKTKDAAAKLNKELIKGTLNKKYLAAILLEETDYFCEGNFVDHLLKDGSVAKIVSAAFHNTSDLNAKDVKEAKLHYHIIKKQDSIALADIEIETGRFHQIRCQMAYHGMPLLGDVKYGSSASIELSREMGIRQTALCANRISFEHPITGKKLDFEVSPENKAFAKFL